MTAPLRNVEDFLQLVAESTNELAKGALGLDGATVLERQAGLPRGVEGSCVALVGDECSLQVGLSSSPEGCRALAGAMLGMEPEGDEMVVDAICELVNVLAGVVKSKVTDSHWAFQIGLPVFVRGSLEVNAHVAAATAEVTLGSVPAHVLVLMSGSSR